MDELSCMLDLQYADGYIEAVPYHSARPQNRGAFHHNRGRVLRRWYWRSAFYQIHRLEARSFC